jgi:ABC-type antimicrobial peptide transport system permease subunit
MSVGYVVLATQPTDNSAAGRFGVLFTVLLAIVAALGVFNTVLLSTRERRSPAWSSRS